MTTAAAASCAWSSRPRAARPERGDFRKTVAFTTAATKGTLIVYAQSMEDGSRQDEVRIPVTFTR